MKRHHENLFNELSIEERAEFDEETLVNVDGIKKRRTPTKNSEECHKEYIVVGIFFV